MRKIISFLIETISNIYVIGETCIFGYPIIKIIYSLLRYSRLQRTRENQNGDINDSSMMMHILRIYTHNFTLLKSLHTGYMGKAVTVEEREPVEITYERSK